MPSSRGLLATLALVFGQQEELTISGHALPPYPPIGTVGAIPAGAMTSPQFKPETKDELFARIDSDNDQAVSVDDYLKRDKYYVESIRNEFNDIDADSAWVWPLEDKKVTKAEFDDYITKLEDQRRTALLHSSNYTLTKHDTDHDRKLSQAELGAYISGTLQRKIAKLPDAFKKFDKDGDGLLDLNEFSELDFQFPWEDFPLSENAYKQIFGAGNT